MKLKKMINFNSSNSYKIEDINIDRDHFLCVNAPEVFSSVAQFGDAILLGSLIKTQTNFLEVHYLDKYASDNKHPSGYLKGESRKPLKGRIIISRLIDRSIRPLLDLKEGYQLIIRLLNNDQKIDISKAAIALAGDLLLQANLIDSPIYPFSFKNGELNN